MLRVIGSTPACSGNLLNVSSPITSAVRSACSTRWRGILVPSAASLIWPVWTSSIRSSSRRVTRSLDAITPVPSPEWTPSVSSETSRLPVMLPRSEVVDHS